MAICLTHTDREATTRCVTCFKPLCDECANIVDGNDFCSSECAVNFSNSEERLVAVRAREKAAERRAQLRKTVTLVIVVAALCGIGFFLSQRPDLVRTIKQKIGLIKDAAEERVQSLPSQ